jgi:excisionase family DNA binding protein
VEQDGFLTLSEAANLLGVSDDAVRKRLKAGSIKGKKVGKRWLIDPESIRKPSGNTPDTKDVLIGQLQEHIRFLQEQVTVKDEQLSRLLTDLEGWREQVRYKELQLAQVQERVIELPQPEAEEAELREPEPDANRNPLVRFWHWFIGK